MNEWTAELYTHAIAIEREAAKRYAELAHEMSARGNHAVSELFRLLAGAERRHLEELEHQARGVALPALTSDYTWQDGEAPENVPLAPYDQITERGALLAALDAERRARAFFEHSARISRDPDTRELAQQMAVEETEHAVLIERMLRRESALPAD